MNSTTNDGVSARTAAIKCIAAVLEQGIRLEQAIGTVSVSDAERPMVRALSFGAMRFGHRLERVAAALVKHNWEEQAPLLKACLLVGLYQLEYAHAPAHAAIHTTVESAKRVGLTKAAGMVNACLRRFQREQQAMTRFADESLGGRFSHPNWMVKRFTRQWPDQAEALMAAANEHPPLTLRVNTLKTTVPELIELLAKDGHAARGLPGGQDAICLERPIDVRGLKVFQDGLCSVQDLAAQWAVDLLDLRPQLSVLDACAAPGGKTGHLLERMPTLSKVLAVDSDPKRMERVDSNLKRLGLKAVLKVGDVTDPAVLGEELFDRILLDAPCSGSGVIRRHPDIKWLRRESDISALSERQLQMLLKLWPRVKPGGQLLYVTCSVFQEENQETIKRFIERQVDARLQANLEALIPVQCRGLGSSHGVQILPGPGQTDGFYYALLNKSH